MMRNAALVVLVSVMVTSAFPVLDIATTVSELDVNDLLPKLIAETVALSELLVPAPETVTVCGDPGALERMLIVLERGCVLSRWIKSDFKPETRVWRYLPFSRIAQYNEIVSSELMVSILRVPEPLFVTEMESSL